VSEEPAVKESRSVGEPRRVRLLVCGNIERGDDGAAVTAVAGLLEDLPSGVSAVLDVRACEQVEIEDLLDVPPTTPCVIVDTVVGIPVGSVATIPLGDLPEHAGVEGPSARSSHILPIGQVVAVADILREEPMDGLFVGIGGGSFEFERALGAPVIEALPAFRDAIAAAIIRVGGQVGGS
jgi:hydrogenase maturation protease